MTTPTRSGFTKINLIRTRLPARRRKPPELHGLHKSPEYKSWSAMRERCLNPRATGFERWGGSGVRICDRWLDSFSAFLKGVGPRPPGHTLDRIDPCGNYEPGNVRWATRKTQANNRRDNVKLTLRGETLVIGEWAARLGISYMTIWDRLRRGWSDERALTQPVLFNRPRASLGLAR